MDDIASAAGWESDMTVTRREAMKHGGKGVAAAVMLPFIPTIAQAEVNADAALLDLESRWYLALARMRKCREAYWQAVDDRPSARRYIPGSPFVLETGRVKILGNHTERAEDEMRVIEDRMTETPAQTIHGIAAKLRVGQGPMMMVTFGRSIVDDAERLAGRAV